MHIDELLHDKRMLLLFALLALAIILVAVRGVHFGIEFEGGTRIPVTLERPVDQLTLTEITTNIKNRVSTFGLQQVLVKAIGDSEIYVELPRSDPGLVNSTMVLLAKQGKFEGIVDGRLAVSNDVIMPGSIRAASPYVGPGGGVQWEVGFALTEGGAVRFANVALGKANYPVYMFLDRPEDAVLLMTRAQVVGNSTLSEPEAFAVLNNTLSRDNSSIPLIVIDDWNATIAQLQLLNRSVTTKAIISDAAGADKVSELTGLGFDVVQKPVDDLTPKFSVSEERVSVSEWRAVGLLSAPILNPSITTGEPGRLYSISGAAPSNIPTSMQQTYAESEVKTLKSILSGGALPVHVIIGTPTTIPAPLGAEFLKYSLIGAVFSVFLVVLFVAIRYRAPIISIPIFLTSAAELILLIGILGSLGTVDTGTMAGIIGAIGTGVNAQILITDEMLAQTRGVTTKRRLGHAFYIIMTNATIAVIAMVPLLFFSGLVEITGFALSVIFGQFIGALITRPAYGAMIEFLMAEKRQL